jgi:hypothetical protein
MAQRRPRSLGFSLNNAWAGGSWELQRGAAQYTWNAIFTARNSSSTSVIAASTASMGVLCLLVCTWPGHEPPGYHPSVSDGVRQSSWPRRHRLADFLVACRGRAVALTWTQILGSSGCGFLYPEKTIFGSRCSSLHSPSHTPQSTHDQWLGDSPAVYLSSLRCESALSTATTPDSDPAHATSIPTLPALGFGRRSPWHRAPHPESSMHPQLSGWGGVAHMRSTLPTVWSSRSNTKRAALGILVSFMYDTFLTPSGTTNFS